MFTTIFFDIGNVLVSFEHGLIWQRFAARSPLAVEDIRRQIRAAGLLDLHETGQLPPREFFRTVQTLVKLPAALSFEEFCVLWADIFEPLSPMITLAQTLQPRYRIILLSNVGEIHWNWLVQRYPIFRQVDGAILSFQVGELKPEPEIYRAALRRAGATPEQCVYIDDVAENVLAGSQLGMHGIHYQSYSQLQNSLKMLPVEW